jgi:hypothetical protein
VGALANVGLAGYLFEQHSGWVTSAVVGVLIGAVWNYAVTAVYTWKRPTVRPAPLGETTVPRAETKPSEVEPLQA